jgi:hypothetical protein
MKKEEIKEYFDKFIESNNINTTSYSYLYFYTSIMKNNKKVVNIVTLDEYPDFIFISYKYKNENYYPFLPLCKFNCNLCNYNDIVNRFIEKTNCKKIQYIPYELNEILNLKLKKLDEEYWYYNENFIKLDGHDKKPIRRYYNKFNLNHKNIAVKRLETNLQYVESTRELVNLWKKDARERNRVFRILDASIVTNWLDEMKYNNLKYNQITFILIEDNNVIGVSNCILSKDNKIACSNIFKTAHFKENYDGISEYMYVETLRLLYNYGVQTFNYGGTIGEKGLKFFKEKMLPYKKTNIYEWIK